MYTGIPSYFINLQIKDLPQTRHPSPDSSNIGQTRNCQVQLLYFRELENMKQNMYKTFHRVAGDYYIIPSQSMSWQDLPSLICLFCVWSLVSSRLSVSSDSTCMSLLMVPFPLAVCSLLFNRFLLQRLTFTTSQCFTKRLCANFCFCLSPLCALS